MRFSRRPYIVMGSLIAVLLTITAGAGVLDKGIYAPFLPPEIVAFQYFQDLVSLVFAPLLLWAMFSASRGSWRWLCVWCGILLFVAYYYSFYGFGFVYTAVYPLYLALMGLGAYSLLGLLASVDFGSFRQAVGEKMPVRLISVVLGITALFIPIWLLMILQRMDAQQAQTTDLVFVLDLPYLIPACLLGAVLLWQKRTLGYLLAGPLLFKATVSGTLLTGGELLKLTSGIPLAVDQLSLYLFLAIVGGTGLILYLRNLSSASMERTPQLHTSARGAGL